jgi:DNA-binding winged helix-turn-helix (wHTH) protein
MDERTTAIWRIGDWRVNPNDGQVSRPGHVAKLDRRTMRLLIVLAENRGHVMSVSELLEHVWPDSVVGTDSVYEAIAALRRVLGDRSTDPTYVETMPRRGYRLIAAASPWVESPGLAPAPADSPAAANAGEVVTPGGGDRQQVSRGNSRAPRILVAGFVGAIIVAGASMLVLRQAQWPVRRPSAPNVSHSAGSESQAVSVAPEVLERHVGFYVRGGHVVLAITREGPHLFCDIPGYATAELVAGSETEFSSKDGQEQWTFVVDGQGRTTGMLHHVGTVASYTWPRIDASAAKQIMADIKAKYESRTPTAGSEAALRRMIDGVRAGKPNYDEMAPWFADLVRPTLYLYASIYAGWGTVQSVEFRHVDIWGEDVYEVHQERGISTWTIFLDSNGLIEDASNTRGL